MTAATALLESNPDLAASVAGHRSGKLPEHINRAVDALHALEFDLSVAHQASSRARVLRSSGAQISRETVVQDSHALEGIFSMILASVMRALMRCGALQARSVVLRNFAMRETQGRARH